METKKETIENDAQVVRGMIDRIDNVKRYFKHPARNSTHDLIMATLDAGTVFLSVGSTLLSIIETHDPVAASTADKLSHDKLCTAVRRGVEGAATMFGVLGAEMTSRIVRNDGDKS